MCDFAVNKYKHKTQNTKHKIQNTKYKTPIQTLIKNRKWYKYIHIQ